MNTIDRQNEIYDDHDYDKLVEFSVKFKIHKRWYKQFIGFLQRLQDDSQVGHSEMVGFYSDGDGDFRFRWTPADETWMDAEKKVDEYFKTHRPDLIDHCCNSTKKHIPKNDDCTVEVFFDAG